MKAEERTVWTAFDGRAFTNMEECQAHESSLRLENSLKEIMDRIGPLPEDKDSRFANGEGYIQRSIDTVRMAALDFMLLADHHGFDLAKKIVANGSFICRYGIIGRVFYDTKGPWYKYWHRFGCIDDSGREWGQPYFAMNPGKGTMMPYRKETP